MAIDSNRPASPQISARVAQATLSSKILLAASIVFIIDSFLAWQRACAEGFGCVSASAWHGVGIIAVLCAIAVLGLEGLRLAGVRLPVEPRIDAYIVAGLGGAVLLFTVIKLLVDDFRGYGLWIGLIVAAVLGAGAVLRLKEAIGGAPQRVQEPFPAGGVPQQAGAPPPPPAYQAHGAVHQAPAPAYQAPPQAPAHQAPASTAPYRLVILRSPAIAGGSSFQLGTQPATVGRAPDSTVPLGGDQHASSRHARLDPLDDGLWIVDLGSTNGTYVNGQAIAARTLLREGDVVRIGETELRIER